MVGRKKAPAGAVLDNVTELNKKGMLFLGTRKPLRALTGDTERKDKNHVVTPQHYRFVSAFLDHKHVVASQHY